MYIYFSIYLVLFFLVLCVQSEKAIISISPADNLFGTSLAVHLYQVLIFGCHSVIGWRVTPSIGGVSFFCFVSGTRESDVVATCDYDTSGAVRFCFGLA